MCVCVFAAERQWQPQTTYALILLFYTYLIQWTLSELFMCRKIEWRQRRRQQLHKQTICAPNQPSRNRVDAFICVVGLWDSNNNGRILCIYNLQKYGWAATAVASPPAANEQE